MHEEFQTVLREHLARYPLMEPQDCAKLAYQSTFGPAHAAGEHEPGQFLPASALIQTLHRRIGAAI
ncbi:hypothetical protein, partial [Dysosmobacter welbionis]|uniref:hypothetical protein n=1 Tax=Dysosmobacter welbionis TaxID=2093857 RepID=UPI0030792A59